MQTRGNPNSRNDGGGEGPSASGAGEQGGGVPTEGNSSEPSGKNITYHIYYYITHLLYFYYYYFIISLF